MDPQRRKAEIIQAAARTFARLGYQKANIYEICREAGIARGTLYQYFKNKNHLFREMLKEHMSKIAAHMVPGTIPQGVARATVDKGLVAGFLKERLKGIFEVVAQERDIFTVFFREAMARHTEVEDLVHDWNHRFLDLMLQEIRTGMKRGMLPQRDPEVLANFLLGGLFKLSHEYILEVGSKGDLDRLAEEASSISTAALMHRDDMPSPDLRHRTSRKGTRARRR